MIYLGDCKKSVLKRKEVQRIEDRLTEIRDISEELPDEKQNDVNLRISAIEFMIQRGRQ